MGDVVGNVRGGAVGKGPGHWNSVRASVVGIVLLKFWMLARALLAALLSISCGEFTYFRAFFPD